MDANGTLVLLHSPLVGAESWGRLPEALGRGGVAARAMGVDTDGRAPFAEGYVRGAVAGVLGGGPLADPLVLVGHSGAGAAARGGRQRAAGRGRPVGGYLFCDAGLPEAGASRLELLAAEDPEMAAGWPDAPCGYLRLSAVYDRWAEVAAARGWPTASLDAGHFHLLVDPGQVAAALLELLSRR